jgi:hypothetical protein
MARFGREFVRAATQPQFAQGLFTAAQQIGSAPARRREEEKKKQLASMMQEVNAALATGDATSIGMARRRLEAAGFSEEANKLVPLETQARQQQAASGMLMSAVSGEPLSPEVMQERLGEGLTPQALASALQVREALKPKPYFTTAEQIDLAKTFTPQSIAEATTERDFGLLRSPDDVDDATVASKITFWTDPTRPNAGVVLKTLQDNEGRTIELGTRTKQNPKGRIISNVELEGLEEQTKPAVQVSLGDKAAEAYGVKTAGGLADFDVTLAGQADTLYPERSSIAEAQNIVEANPEVFGFAATTRQSLREASLYLINSIGASADDPIRDLLADQSADADMIQSFTQDFVRKRMEATKGAITEREFDTFMASVPNLLQSAAGYKRLLNYMNSVNERAIMYSEAMRDVLTFSGREAQKDATELRSVWGKFTADFPLATFMPPSEQKKLFDFYRSKEGKVNRGDDVVFTFSADSSSGPITYNQLSQRAAKAGKTTQQYITDLYYGNTGKTIKLDLSGFDF